MEKLARLFAGRVPVHSLRLPERHLPVLSSRSDVPLHRLCLTPPIKAARFLAWKRLPARTTALGPLRYEAACQGVPLMAGVSVSKAETLLTAAPSCHRILSSRLVSLPQSRTNRLRYLAERWKPEGASVLALFSPIIKDSLLRSALDKQTGSLLCWMNPAPGKGDPFFLLLLSKGGQGGQRTMEWVWLPLPGE
jgi:hypothetical protein